MDKKSNFSGTESENHTLLERKGMKQDENR